MLKHKNTRSRGDKKPRCKCLGTCNCTICHCWCLWRSQQPARLISRIRNQYLYSRDTRHIFGSLYTLAGRTLGRCSRLSAWTTGSRTLLRFWILFDSWLAITPMLVLTLSARFDHPHFLAFKWGIFKLCFDQLQIHCFYIEPSSLLLFSFFLTEF